MPFWKCFSCLKFPSDDNVIKLDYSNGTLTDIPPDVSQFERTLEELYLSSNRITDLPPELFYCQGLRVLKLNDNELETIPNAIGSLRQLQMLDLSRNALAYIPENIKLCKYLTHLDLSLNNLQRFPDAITNLISLQELYLNETYLEYLPANFGRLTNLKILELRSNNLITLPKSMSRLTGLIRIDIGANEFTELPEVIGQLTQLKELWIDYNKIRRISANISNLNELVHFEANNNQLNSLPNEISHWKKLEVLSLSTNDLELLPFSIGMLKNLITLKCDSNSLRELPDSICHLVNLEEMVINHNFVMRIPSTIGLLRKLKFLAADENLLRKLPDEICSCTELSVLSLRGNKLIVLPRDIGHLINLKVLNIVNNSISYLPVSILNLTQLTALWISDNQSQPLVPLQYIDTDTKTALTCFMLPQAGSNASTKAQQQHNLTYQSNDRAGNSWPNQQIQQKLSLTIQQLGDSPPISASSPSRRICFADETSTKTNDATTTRLMRSPTPYPKDLRLMAKYVKNLNQSNNSKDNNEMISPTMANQRETNKQNELLASLRIKEAKVLSKPGGVKYSPNDNYDENNTPINVNATNCDMSSAQVNYLYNTLKTVDNNTGNYINLQRRSSYDTIDSHMSHITNMGIQNASQQYDRYPGYNNAMFVSETQNWEDSTYEVRLPESTPLNFTQISYQQVPRTDFSHRQPPPYHIAKAYTKKSREDLLNYDSLRNQTEFNSSPSRDNDYEDNVPVARSNIDDNFNINIGGGGNDCNKVICDNNNSFFVDPEMKNDIECMEKGEYFHHSIRNFPNNISMHDSNNSRDAINGHPEDNLQYNQNNNSIKGPQKAQHQWLFGLHKNPTVRQVVIKKDPVLGFEIKEIPNQGIFISIIIPNTSAASLLRANDKILDVDGFDFNKISLAEAKQILVDSGPVLTIMISRK